MNRRAFLQVPLTGTLLGAPAQNTPAYRVVSAYRRIPNQGMPGAYPGRVVTAHSPRCIDESTRKGNPDVVREMIARGMATLTGDSKPADAWRRFFDARDVVGIKVNCSGAPRVCSNPTVVAEIVRNLIAVDVKPSNIWIYERFKNQMDSVRYEQYVPEGVRVYAVETPRGSIRNYDPRTYVEVNFFGEDDTRSNLVRHVSETFTKIVNVPNMKDHGASGVTGCLKNIAYGNFSNVARSHREEKTNTLSFIGTLAAVEPLRSKTVLHVMDGLMGVWHGGPFVRDDKFVFYPRRIAVGTDPVAMDRQLLDIIEAERKAKGTVSVWDRDPKHISRTRPLDPDYNAYIREPGHIEFAHGLGLGVYDQKSIRHTALEIA